MSLTRYRTYRRVSADWLDQLPEHWSLAPLKYLVRLRSGGTPNKENLNYWGGRIPWASAKDLKSHCLADTIDHITQRALDDGAARLVESGSLLVIVRGMTLAHSFPVVRTLVPMTINQDLKAIAPCGDLDLGYLAWLLRGSTDETLRRLDEAGHGTKALRMDSWLTMAMPVPPVSEQLAITAFLDCETAKIDALVAEQKRLIELLAKKRQAIVTHAVTKGLNPKAQMKRSGVAYLGDIPCDWRVLRVKHVVAPIEQGWSPQCENFPVQSAAEWGVLKVGCVNGGSFDPSENKALPASLEAIPSLAVRVGDVLVSRANTRELVGSAAVVPDDHPRLMLSDKLFRLRCDPSTCDARFLAFYLGSQSARSEIELDATGASASMVNIGQDTILNLAFPAPSLAMQREIIAFIQAENGALSSLESEIKRSVEVLGERRSALISAAVTGKIDVRTLVSEPADSDADVALMEAS